MSYAKPFNEKMRKQLAKIYIKKKKYVSDFSTLSIDDTKTKRKTFCTFLKFFRIPFLTEHRQWLLLT